MRRLNLLWLVLLPLVLIAPAVSAGTTPAARPFHQEATEAADGGTILPTAEADPLAPPPVYLAPELTPEPTFPADATATEVATEAPTATETATETATATPEGTAETTATPEGTAEATAEATATLEPTDAATEAPVLTPTPEYTSEVIIDVPPTEEIDLELLARQTFCLMDIDDLNDDNAFTYQFSSPNAFNISSFNWNFGDTNTAVGQTVNHTYSAPGTYTITLTCNPTIGSPLVLTGSIRITTVPQAAFTLSPIGDPPNTANANPPFRVTTVNQSTGSGLTYQWTVTGPAPATTVVATGTSENISVDLTSFGLFTFTLIVTDAAGSGASASQSFALNPLPPGATFTVNPTSGTAPLTVTVTGIDEGPGPLTTVTFDMGEDGSNDIDFTGLGPHTFVYNTASVTPYTITMNYSGPGGSGQVIRQVLAFENDTTVSAAFSWRFGGTDGNGNIEICFTNNSTGPVAITQWDWDGDGGGTTFDTPATLPGAAPFNASEVCHVYPAAGQYLVYMRVRNASNTSSSTASSIVNVVAAPQANFTISPSSTINQGQTINLTDTSTGVVLRWSWDFNGDGIEDSNVRNPSNVLLTQLGANPITLTVFGVGDSQATATRTVFVARVDITCDITGPVEVLPTATGNSTYNSVIGNQLGRTISYNWTVTSPNLSTPLTFNTQNISFNPASTGPGSYLVTLETSTADGSFCSTSETVNVTYQSLDCQLGVSPTPPGTQYPSSQVYTFTANVGNLQSRPVVTYRWYVDDVLQSGQTSSTFQRSWTANTAVTEVIRYEVDVTNTPGSSISTCGEPRTITITPFPTSVCSFTNITPTIPSPLYPDGATYTFTVSASNLQGRTIQSVAWAVDGTPQSATGTTFGFVNPNTVGSRVVTAVATLLNPDGTTSTCSQASRTVTSVAYPAITCSITPPGGFPNPLYPNNQNYVFTGTVTGAAGRPITYTWTGATPNGSGATATYNNTFNPTPTTTQTRTITFEAFVTNPGGSTTSCTPQTLDLTITPYPAPTCSISLSALPTPLYPNGATYTVTANVTATNGRTVLPNSFTWTVNGSSIADNDNSIQFVNGTTLTPDPRTFTVTALVQNPDGTTTQACTLASASRAVTAYPDFSGGGTGGPCPITALSNPNVPLYNDGRSYQFRVDPDAATVAGRTLVGYAWTAVGGTLTNSTSQTATFANSTAATPTVRSVTVTVTLNDPSANGGTGGTVTCTRTLEFTITTYPAPVCSIADPSGFPGTLRPNGVTYTFTGSVTAATLQGRTVVGHRWLVDGVEQTGQTSATFPYVNQTTDTPSPRVITYVATVQNPDGTTVECSPGATRTLTITAYSALTCTISGPTRVLPRTPDNLTRTSQYTVTVTNAQGRVLSYNYTVVGGTVASGGTTNQPNITWNSSSASLPTAPSDESLQVTVTATTPGVGPSGTAAVYTCTPASAYAVAAEIQRLVCNLPTGPSGTIIGPATPSYSLVGRVDNTYGRTAGTRTWTLEQESPFNSGTYVFVENGSGDTYQPSLAANARYRIRYSYTSLATDSVTSDTLIGDTCASGDVTVTTRTADFTCGASLSGPATPNNANLATAYQYNYTTGNADGMDLTYTYTIISSTGVRTQIDQFNSTANGVINRSFTLPVLGPVGPENYTLEIAVRATNPAQSATTCTRTQPVVVGSININGTAAVAGGFTSSNVPTGADVCFTNTTAPRPGDNTNLTHTWQVTGGITANASWGAAVQNGFEPPCLRFSQPGTYTVTQTATSANGNRNETRTYTFTVFGQQSLSVARASSEIGAPAFGVRFVYSQTNLTSAITWEIRDSSNNIIPITGTAGNQITADFQNPGLYTVTARGTGPLGENTASLQFRLLGVGDLAARFTPSVYAGIAPLRVCFTDQSIFTGQAIQTWRWDFDGDGTDDLTYTASTIPSEICYTYPDAGRTYTPRLIVDNGSRTDSATNTIRTYTQLESSASFSVQPQGGRQFCFTPILTGGLVVTSWNFGDGATLTPVAGQTVVCHTYAGTGSFQVTMNVRDPGTGQTGSVVRTVRVTNDPVTVPALSAIAQCSLARVATLTLTNNGGAMLSDDELRVTNGGSVIAVIPFRLGAGETRDFTFSNISGPIAFATIDTQQSASATCNFPPTVTVVSQCVNNLPVFTITNTAANGPMQSAQDYTVSDPSGNTILDSAFQLAGGESIDVTMPAGSTFYGEYTFESAGDVGTFNVARQCNPEPNLILSTACAFPLTFTIENDGADMVAAANYTITTDSPAVTIQSGTVQLAANGIRTFTLTGLNPYIQYTLTVSGGGLPFASTSAFNTCAQPVLDVTSTCADPVVFTVTNTGGPMLTSVDYTVTTGSPATTVRTGTISGLATNGTQQVTLTGEDPYAGYTLTTSGQATNFITNTSGNANCARPALTFTHVCSNPLVITVTNAGGPVLVGVNYTVVRNSDSVQVASGTFSSIAGNGGTATVTLTSQNPFASGGYTISTSGGFTTTTPYTTDCAVPVLDVTSTCAYPIVFTVTNNGGDLDYAVNVEIVRVSTSAVVLSTTLNSLAAGDATTFDTGTENPYLSGGYRITLTDPNGFVTTATGTRACAQPVLDVTSTCANPVVFTVTNTGGPMLTSVDYTVTTGSPATTVRTGTISGLATNGTQQVTLTSEDPYAGYTLSTSGQATNFITNTSGDANCARPVLTVTHVCASPVVFTVTNTGGPMLTPVNYTVTTGSPATTVRTGTISGLATNGTQQVTLTSEDPYAGYTLSTSGQATNFITNTSGDANCARPALSVTHVCADPVVFTVTNTGGPMLTPVNYAVTTGSPAVTVVSGTISGLATNGTQQVTLTGRDPYAGYTLTTSGQATSFITNTSGDANCGRPVLDVTSTCASPIVFTITNNGTGDMLSDIDYDVESSDGSISFGGTIFALDVGDAQQVTLTGRDPYLGWTLTTNDGDGFIAEATRDQNCARPVLSVTSTCASPVVFTVTNTGGPMLTSVDYTVTTGSPATTVRTGTISGLATNGTQQVTLTGEDPYAGYTLTTSGQATNFVTDTSGNANCARPVLEVTSTCANPVVFTVTNTGGPMLTPVAYTVTTGSPPNAFLNGTITGLATNGTQQITLTGRDPYNGYTLTTSGQATNFVTDTSGTANCIRPILTVTTTCASPVTLTVTNSGGPMLNAVTYTITTGSPSTTVETGTLNLLTAGGQQTFTLTGLDPYAGYTLSTNDLNGFISNDADSANCARPVFEVTSTCADPIVFTIRNTGGPMLLDAQYTVTNSEGNLAFGGTISGLATNGTQQVTLTGEDPYAGWTLTTSGGFATHDTLAQNCARPVLEVTSVCANPIVFTITNTGGPMLLDAQYTVENSEGNIAFGGTINALATNGTQQVTLTGEDPYAGWTLTTSGGFATHDTLAQNCARPVFEVTSTCADPIVFTITNTGGQMLLTASYLVENSEGNFAISGSIGLLAPNEAQLVTLTGEDPYAGWTLTTSDGFATHDVLFQPCERPVLEVTSVCAETIVFTVTNVGGPMLTDVGFTVENVDQSGGVVGLAGLLPRLTKNMQTQIALTGEDPYVGWTFTTSGAFVVGQQLTQSCARPALEVTSSCAYPIVFTIRNTGGQLVTTLSYTVTNDTTGAQVATGTLTGLNPNATTTVTLTDLDPYAGYTIATTGGFVPATSTAQPCARPVFTVTSTCAYPIVFTVTNTGGRMLTPVTYTVTNVTTGVQAATGTLTGLNPNGAQTVTLTGLDPYAGYTLATTGGFTTATSTTQPCARPVLTAEALCANPVVFTVRNSGGPMLLEQPYTITDSTSTVATGTFTLARTGETQITLDGRSPYAAYQFSSNGFAGEVVRIHDCADPVLNLTAQCVTVAPTAPGTAPAAEVRIVNTGSAMLTPHVYRGTVGSSTVIPDTLFLLGAGESLTVPVSRDIARQGVTLSTDTFGIVGTVTIACAQPTATPRAIASGFIGTGTPAPLSFSPAAATCGGRNCPPYLVYHTDETGDWEIFRLDGFDEVERTTARENLTYGEGPDVSDTAPSLSPNNQWMVFASNRDGNWEVYVASTSGDRDSVQRVTYNNVAIDIDPVWGPGQYVIFETTRFGQWDLMLIDMETGRTMRLTDDEGDDINAFWSNDGTRVLFQSDRPDENGERKWQIYELNLATMQVTKLSDGSSIDVDPQYANTSNTIAFRSYAVEGDNSVITLMDEDGSDRRAITDPAGDATNASWSPTDRYIAYQSNLDGDLDVYAYEVATGETRQLSDNTIADYAPTWRCTDERVIYTSDIDNDPNIFEQTVPPIRDPAVDLLTDESVDQMTFELSNDIYPLNAPVEENASREGQTVAGAFGEQTSFLFPDVSYTPIDLSDEDSDRDDWMDMSICPAS
jgi:PKD repeat protein/Tol biopolymer transport system component